MNQEYKKFYKGCYLNTGGYFPTKPLSAHLYPGDFYQIINGAIIVLGNIFRDGLVASQEAQINDAIQLNPAAWSFSDGVRKAYSGREKGQNPIDGEFEYIKQILTFDEMGSYFLKGNNPEAIKIANWNDLQQGLIVELTTTMFSFREVYIVTEVVTLSDWTLAVSGSSSAELEIANNSEDHGLMDIFGHASTKTIQSKDMEYYHKEEARKPNFFKAKKLVVQNEKSDVFISNLISRQSNHHEWASDFFSYEFHQKPTFLNPASFQHTQMSTLDMLQPNDLNPATALQYFRWENANLDDIEKLFISYSD